MIIKNINVKIIYGETVSNKTNGNAINTPWKLSLDKLLSEL